MRDFIKKLHARKIIFLIIGIFFLVLAFARVKPTKAGGQVTYLIQSLIDQNGRDSWYRRCILDGSTTTGVKDGSCDTFANHYVALSVGDAAHPGTGTFGGYGAYVFPAGGVYYLIQSLIDKNGTDSWWRKCVLDGSSFTGVGACDNFANHYVALSVGDTAHPGTGKFSAYGAFTFTSGGTTYLLQSLIDQNGRDSWYRRCILDGSTENGTRAGSCDNFANHYVALSVGDTAHPGTGTFGGYGTFTFASGGNTYLIQSLVDKNGTDSWYRRCVLDGSSFTGVGACDTFADHYIALSVGDSAHPGTGKFSDYDAFTFVGESSSPPPATQMAGLNFKVKLPDVASSVTTIAPSDGMAGILLQIIEGSTPIMSDTTVTLVRDGDYFKPSAPVNLPITQDKAYNILFQSRVTLRRMFNNVVLTRGQTLDCSVASNQSCGELITQRNNKSLWSGDGDAIMPGSDSYNKIDSADLQAIAVNFDRAATTALARNVDFNSDGRIDINDLEILGRNFGKVGE